MSADAQRAFIEKFLLNTFKATYPEFDVVINNDMPPAEPSKYVEYHDLAGDGRQGELTSKAFNRFVGVLQIDIMVPEDKGPGQASKIGDWLIATLSSKSFSLPGNSTLNFRVGSHRWIGVAHGMSRRSFRIGYWRDDRKMGSV